MKNCRVCENISHGKGLITMQDAGIRERAYLAKLNPNWETQSWYYRYCPSCDEIVNARNVRWEVKSP